MFDSLRSKSSDKSFVFDSFRFSFEADISVLLETSTLARESIEIKIIEMVD